MNNKKSYCNIQISSKKLKCDDKKRDINILEFEDTLKNYTKEGLTNEDE